MATPAYALPDGAEELIEGHLVQLLALAIGSNEIRLRAVAARAVERFPALADWPEGLLLRVVRHIDMHVMAGLQRRAAAVRPLRLVGEDDDRLVVNDLLRDDEEDGR